MSSDNKLEHHSHRKGYIIIFFVLGFLTLVELYIPGLSVAYNIKAALLVFLALAKAFVVAYYYMHLNEETRWLKFIAAIPITAGLYATVLVLEALYQSKWTF